MSESQEKESTYTYRLYLVMQGIIGLIFAMIFTVELLYHVEVVKLDPLRLVLLGTILEGTIFLCEVPTGILADVKSRKLSIIIGYILMGMGFLIEGGFPIFVAAAIAQVLWGLGYTFTSGAIEAWIVDELHGTIDTGAVFLRGHQASRFGNFSGILLGTAFGNIRIGLPIVLGGALLVASGLGLLAIMPENHYVSQTCEHTILQNMGSTVKKAFRLVRAYHVIGILLLISVFYGGHSEGIDRLWTPFLVQQFRLPFAPFISTVTWLGIIEVMLSLGALGGTEVLKRLNVTKDIHTIRKALFGFIVMITLSIMAFGTATTFWVAVAMFMILKLFQGMSHPLYQTWLNSHITDSQIRATMFSIGGQCDAIGQITCGPVVGWIGNTYGLRMAFYASAAILSPVLGLYLLIQKLHHKTLLTAATKEEYMYVEDC